MTTDLGQSSIDSRKLALANWVAINMLGNAPGDHPPITLQSLGSDAGFRRYFRFQSPSQWLAVDAPPATEDSLQFIAIAKLIRDIGAYSPQVFAADPTQGFLLVEDMGDNLLYRAINSSNADQLYTQAIDTLLQIHGCEDNPGLIPRYERALLRRELELFNEWFAGKLLGYRLNNREQQQLDRLFTLLEDNALTQPQAFVHRDYHSRNLILRSDGNLGVIDFQGALWGGVTYDLVSLLRDCYLRWPAEKVVRWALYYRQRAIELQQLPAVGETEFLRWFDLLGLQRHIKVLGIFARLHLRDDKPGYLQDLPLVIRYTMEVAGQYPELLAFASWFSHTLLPLAQQQSWYRDYHTAGETP